MKKILLLAILIIPWFSAQPAGTVYNKAQKKFFENRRIAVSRDTQTIPGSVITVWQRNGVVESVVTNTLHAIAGREQNNPLQARLQRANAALDEKRAEYVQKRDAATLPTTKAIYQAFIDAIDRIKEKLANEK